jgi:septum formation protein
MGVEFTVEPSGYDEKLDDSRSIEDVALELSLGKARDVAAHHPQAIVIGSDTIVGINDHQLEKPTDSDEARRMLESYAGRESVVVTGVAVIHGASGTELNGFDVTKVYFKSDSSDVARLRESYIATGDWADKAGGYGIQNVRDTLIDHIDGDYDTVIGLPTRLLARLLAELGIDTKPVEVSPGDLYDD